MTQGIVSIRKDGAMVYKVVVGHDGQNAPKVASRVRSLAHLPTIEELATICAEEEFGCNDCLIILENDSENWNRPKILKGKEVDWDDGNPEYERYFDTFHVAEFNPRWKYGIAAHVEVIDAIETTMAADPEIRHLWTDEEVADMKAKGIISEDAPEGTGFCKGCSAPVGDRVLLCDKCNEELPF